MRSTVLLVAGCAGADADALRTAWLVNVLHTDNLVWQARDPALLQVKYDRMAADPYDYVRGSSAVFLQDLARAGTGRLETTFLTAPDAAEIAIVGDPHPENLGLFVPGFDETPIEPSFLLEVADLDGAGFGPYLVDVRRAMLGLATLLDGAGCDRPCRRPILEEEAEGYADEILDVADGDLPTSTALVPGAAGVVLDRALDDLVEQGLARTALRDHTEPGPDGLRFRTAAAADLAGDGLVHLTLEESAELDRLLARLETPPGFRVRDVARRYGVGVASLPAVRYVVLWDEGLSGDGDDAVVQLREVVDPPSIPGVRSVRTWDGQGERIVASTLSAWTRDDVDPWLQTVADGARTFKVSTWSSWDETLDHERIAEDFQEALVAREDLEELAETLGRHLGGVHARATAASGAPALTAVSLDLGGRADRFAAEQVAAAEVDLLAALRDHRLFARALADGVFADAAGAP